MAKNGDLRGDLSESINDSQNDTRGPVQTVERLFDERCFEANEPGRREDDTGWSLHCARPLGWRPFRPKICCPNTSRLRLNSDAYCGLCTFIISALRMAGEYIEWLGDFMEQTGQIKMTTEIGEPIQYWLPMGEEEIAMNPFIGKEVSFSYDGLITCVLCDRKTKKSFNQGMCYPCMLNAPEASECIIKPELCQGHLGGGRDVEWEQAHHVQPHYVYWPYRRR